MKKNLFIIFCFILTVSSIFAAVPQKINYQGYLTDSGGTPINGTRTIVFRLYSLSTGGSALWTETQTDVPVTNGIFNVILGSVTPVNNTSLSFFRDTLYLSVQIQGEASEMSPRHELTSAAYAFASSKVVQKQVVTVAQEGGDTNTVYAALQIIAGLSPVPSASSPYIIEVKAGVYNEIHSWSIPNYVSLTGAGEGVTVINFGTGQTITMMSYCSMENISINMDFASNYISYSFSTGSRMRHCSITGNCNPFFISFLSTTNCVFADNTVRFGGASANYFIYMQNATGAQIKNNYFDISGAANSTAIYAANTIECVISGNTIMLQGATDNSRGISINSNYSSTRVSNNIFYGEATTPQGNDIYSASNSGYPVRPTHAGPYGIGNQGSSGNPLPNF